MKNIFIILSFILLLSIIIKCDDNNKDKLQNEDNEDDLESNDDIENFNNDKEEQTEEEEDNANLKGIYMSQKTFDEKLAKIIEEKGLNKKKKITKEKLKIIFEEIYKEDLDPNDEDQMKPEEEQSFLDLVFNQLTKSYDYDDKIKIKEIRDMISPKQAQDAMFTVYADMAESMGFL